MAKSACKQRDGNQKLGMIISPVSSIFASLCYNLLSIVDIPVIDTKDEKALGRHIRFDERRRAAPACSVCIIPKRQTIDLIRARFRWRVANQSLSCE